MNNLIQFAEAHAQTSSNPATISATVAGFTHGHMLLVCLASRSDPQSIFDIEIAGMHVTDTQGNSYRSPGFGAPYTPSVSGMAAYVNGVTGAAPNVWLGCWAAFPSASGSITVSVQQSFTGAYDVRAMNLIVIEIDGIVPNPNTGSLAGPIWTFPSLGLVPGSSNNSAPVAEAINYPGHSTSSATSLTASVGSVTPGLSAFLPTNGPMLVIGLALDSTTASVTWSGSTGLDIWAISQNPDATNPLSFGVLARNFSSASSQPFSFTGGTFTSGDGVLILIGALGPNLRANCGNPPPAIIGVPYSHFLPASQGMPFTGDPTAQDYGWLINTGTLPAGLSLNAATGEIHGTPTGPVGTDGVIFNVYDTQGSGVSPPGPASVLFSCQLQVLATAPSSGVFGTFTGETGQGKILGGNK